MAANTASDPLTNLLLCCGLSSSPFVRAHPHHWCGVSPRRLSGALGCLLDHLQVAEELQLVVFSSTSGQVAPTSRGSHFSHLRGSVLFHLCLQPQRTELQRAKSLHPWSSVRCTLWVSSSRGPFLPGYSRSNSSSVLCALDLDSVGLFSGFPVLWSCLPIGTQALNRRCIRARLDPLLFIFGHPSIIDVLPSAECQA